MIELKFNSFDEFLTKVQEPSLPNARLSEALREGASNSWDLKAGWDGAIKMAKEGWPEGLKRMQKVAELLEMPSGARSYEPQPVLAVAGDEVDIGAYLSGEPECMMDWEVRATPSFGKVVKIVCHLTANASVSANAMFRRGSLAYLIIDALESCGIRCEVWGLVKCSTCGNRDEGPDFLAQVCLKDADQPIEPDRLAYMLAHPAVFRRLGFRLMELTPEYTRGCYGSTVNPPEELMEGDGVIFLGGSHLGYTNDQDIVASAKQIASKYIGEEAPL